MLLTRAVSFLQLFFFFFHVQLTMTAKQTVLEEFRAAYSTSHWEDALKAVGSEYSYSSVWINRRCRIVLVGGVVVRFVWS